MSEKRKNNLLLNLHSNWAYVPGSIGSLHGTSTSFSAHFTAILVETMGWHLIVFRHLGHCIAKHMIGLSSDPSIQSLKPSHCPDNWMQPPYSGKTKCLTMNFSSHEKSYCIWMFPMDTAPDHIWHSIRQSHRYNQMYHHKSLIEECIWMLFYTRIHYVCRKDRNSRFR